MSKTLKVTIILVALLVSGFAGFFTGTKVGKVDVERLSVCLQPYAGNVTLKDKEGKDQQVTVVVASQIGACIESN